MQVPLLLSPRSRPRQIGDPAGATATGRWIPLAPARYGTRVARRHGGEAEQLYRWAIATGDREHAPGAALELGEMMRLIADSTEAFVRLPADPHMERVVFLGRASRQELFEATVAAFKVVIDYRDSRYYEKALRNLEELDRAAPRNVNETGSREEPF